MSKIRFAIVEDEQLYLDDRCENLDELKNECDVDVVIKAHNAEEFFAEYRKNPDNVDALILDIDLTGSYTGLQIAEKVLKPSLFVSGYNAKYLNSIEDLSDRIDVVMHITKPMSDDRFKNTVRSFCKEIRLHQLRDNNTLRFKRKGTTIEINVKDIVFFMSISDGSNKKFYFKDKDPIEITDCSFSDIMDQIDQNLVPIVQIHKRFYVNKMYVESRETEGVKVSYIDIDKESKLKKMKVMNRVLPVTSNYVKNIR